MLILETVELYFFIVWIIWETFKISLKIDLLGFDLKEMKVCTELLSMFFQLNIVYLVFKTHSIALIKFEV